MHIYNLYNIYIPQKGDRGSTTPNPKGENSEMLEEGGFHRIIPLPVRQGDPVLRTHPPTNPKRSGSAQPCIVSSSRFQTQGNKRSKSNRNGVASTTLYHCSIAVTNRTRSSSNAVILYVNNFVRNYSSILLPIHYGFTKAFIVHNIVRNSTKVNVEATTTFHIGIFTTTND